MGYCSRSQAIGLIAEGRVTVNGRTCRDLAQSVDMTRDQIGVDGKAVRPSPHGYFMLNKPRGLVTTMHDEQERETVYTCLSQAGAPRLPAVGQLDKASEGLLLFSNDHAWAAGITDPASGISKEYHVQIRGGLTEPQWQQLRDGIVVDEELLAAKKVWPIREGERNAWVGMELVGGRNRHIRRMFEALEIEVLRLIRIRIGPLLLGDLAKGAVRDLSQAEIEALGGRSRPPVNLD